VRMDEVVPLWTHEVECSNGAAEDESSFVFEETREDINKGVFLGWV
jgi:hypothetical protein